MFIVRTSEYVPARIVDNEYFGKILQKPPAWFIERTGIRERRRCASDENLHTLAIAAVRALSPYPSPFRERGWGEANIDLIIGASYTPLDTIGTMAHVIQREFHLHGAKAIYLSTACSSFLDALDIASMYFKARRVRQALIVAAEHNSAHSRDEDVASGHLWGDGASAVLLRDAETDSLFEIVQIQTQGLADRGHGPDAVSLRRETGLTMSLGREVFAQACEGMTQAVRDIVAAHALSTADVRLLVAHQANRRIIDRVAGELQFPADRVAVTIDSLGNTGCASVPITLHRFAHRVSPGEFAVLVAFGGGYSVGAALLRRTGATQAIP